MAHVVWRGTVVHGRLRGKGVLPPTRHQPNLILSCRPLGIFREGDDVFPLVPLHRLEAPSVSAPCVVSTRWLRDHLRQVHLVLGPGFSQKDSDILAVRNGDNSPAHPLACQLSLALTTSYTAITRCPVQPQYHPSPRCYPFRWSRHFLLLRAWWRSPRYPVWQGSRREHHQTPVFVAS